MDVQEALLQKIEELQKRIMDLTKQNEAYRVLVENKDLKHADALFYLRRSAV